MKKSFKEGERDKDDDDDRKRQILFRIILSCFPETVVRKEGGRMIA